MQMAARSKIAGSLLGFLFLSAAILCPTVCLRAQEKAKEQKGDQEGADPNIAASQIQAGDRLLIVLRNGSTFRGTVVETGADRISLDMSKEEGGVNATIDLLFTDIASARRMRPTSREAAARAEALRNKELEDSQAMADKVEKQHRAEAEARAKQEEKAREKQERERQQEIERTAELTERALVAQFPPNQGWGPERRKLIEYRFLNMHLNPTEEEQRFLDLYDQWYAAAQKVQALDAKRKQETRQEKLLERFPPDKGWGSDRRAELLAREADGKAISAEERDFLENFDEWLAGYGKRRGTETPAGENK